MTIFYVEGERAPWRLLYFAAVYISLCICEGGHTCIRWITRARLSCSTMCFCAFVWQLTRDDGTTNLYHPASASFSLSRNFVPRIRAYPLALARSLPFSTRVSARLRQMKNIIHSSPQSAGCKMRRFYFGDDLNRNENVDSSFIREYENLFIIIFILHAISITVYM